MSRPKFSTKVVVACVVANVVFTAAVLYICLTVPTAKVPDALIVGWYAFWGAELVSLASIRKSKIKNKYEVEQ